MQTRYTRIIITLLSVLDKFKAYLPTLLDYLDERDGPDRFLAHRYRGRGQTSGRGVRSNWQEKERRQGVQE